MYPDYFFSCDYGKTEYFGVLTQVAEASFTKPSINQISYKDRIYDPVLIRENTGESKPVFSHILCND